MPHPFLNRNQNAAGLARAKQMLGGYSMPQGNLSPALGRILPSAPVASAPVAPPPMPVPMPAPAPVVGAQPMGGAGAGMMGPPVTPAAAGVSGPPQGGMGPMGGAGAGMKRGGRAKKAEGGSAMKPISRPNARSITEIGVRAYGRELSRGEGGKFGANPYKNPAVSRKELDEEMPRKRGGRTK